MEKELPIISYIIPTYNADQYLKRCLNSIFMQDYPIEKFEVIIADGGSTDETLSIVRTFDVVLLDNPARDAESGKFLALEKAKGEIIILLDSDNIIVSKQWLKKMVSPLQENSDIIGVESNYLIADDFGSLNIYANLLVIVDPLARMLANKPEKVIKKKHYHIKYFGKNKVPVSGANGFLWRKSVVEMYNDKSLKKLSEANLLSEIAKNEIVKYANIPNMGIYHYYCNSFGDYVKKRKKIARKFLTRKKNQENTWVDKRSKLYFIFCVIYLATFIGPLIEAMINFIKTKKKEWLLHPVISFITICIYVFYFVINNVKKSI